VKTMLNSWRVQPLLSRTSVHLLSERRDFCLAGAGEGHQEGRAGRLEDPHSGYRSITDCDIGHFCCRGHPDPARVRPPRSGRGGSGRSSRVARSLDRGRASGVGRGRRWTAVSHPPRGRAVQAGRRGASRSTGVSRAGGRRAAVARGRGGARRARSTGPDAGGGDAGGVFVIGRTANPPGRRLRLVECLGNSGSRWAQDPRPHASVVLAGGRRPGVDCSGQTAALGQLAVSRGD